jgi:hypothetical protein
MLGMFTLPLINLCPNNAVAPWTIGILVEMPQLVYNADENGWRLDKGIPPHYNYTFSSALASGCGVRLSAAESGGFLDLHTPEDSCKPLTAIYLFNFFNFLPLPRIYFIHT